MTVARPKICVSTGTRAEYGLVYWLMRDLVDHPDFELQVAVSAMHLLPAFGETVNFIRADGFRIDAEIPCLDDDDSDLGMAHGYVRAMSGFVAAFDRLKPDILVLLGDRFEALAAAVAATLLHIPIAHIHGGEVTLGAIDDTFRHAITKMTHLHFAAAEPYARRIVQMGEAPERVYNVGAVGLDNFMRLTLPDAESLAADLGVDIQRPYALVTYHPVTMGGSSPLGGLEQLLSALEAFPDMPVIITKANADPGGRVINARLETFEAAHRDRVKLVASLGQTRYLAAMKHAGLVVGNSSSGLIEAPAVNVPSVNVGDRQDGRLRAKSVIDVPDEETAIVAAMKTALAPEFRSAIAADKPPYGRPGNATGAIIAALEGVDFSVLPARKPFHDLLVDPFKR